MKKFNEEKYPVSVDLQETCLYQLNFLQKVDSEPHLFKEQEVKRAIWRYEKFWMPFAASFTGTEDIVPPLDVHWVWHVHMLAPHYYRQDSVKMVGKVVPHKLLQKDKYEIALIYTKQMWQKQFEELFEADTNACLPESTGESKITYDLLSAVKRQKEFYYHVSFPHFRDIKFLNNAIRRYKMLLYLKQRYPDEFVVPCYDMDLVWHTHQLHPVEYHKDTTAILGKIFNHDDNMTDRGPDSKLYAADMKMRELWKQNFDEPYSCSGAMYRGVRPSDLLKQPPVDLTSKHSNKTVKMLVMKIDISNTESFTSKSCLTLVLLEHNGTKTTINKLKGPNMNFTLEEHSLNGFYFNNKKNDCLLLEEYKKSGPFGLGDYRKISECRLDFTSKMEDLFNSGQIVKLQGQLKKVYDPKRPRRNLLVTSTVSLQMRVSSVNFSATDFTLKTGSFEKVIMPETIEKMWGPVPLPKLPPGQDNECNVATHMINNFWWKPALTCRVIHSIPLQMSAVQVYHQDHMLCVSHLIGSSQLPHSKQVSTVTEPIPTLNIENGDKAMLLKDCKGDWAIVKGKWTGVKKGIPGSGRTKGKPGDPGYLRCQLFNLKNGRHYQQDMKLDTGTKVFCISNLKSSLSSGDISILPAEEDIAQYVCLALSVAVLHVLCQPKFKTSITTRGKKQVKVPITSGMAMARAVGYEDRDVHRPSDLYFCGVMALGLDGSFETSGNETSGATGGSEYTCDFTYDDAGGGGGGDFGSSGNDTGGGGCGAGCGGCGGGCGSSGGGGGSSGGGGGGCGSSCGSSCGGGCGSSCGSD